MFGHLDSANPIVSIWSVFGLIGDNMDLDPKHRFIIFKLEILTKKSSFNSAVKSKKEKHLPSQKISLVKSKQIKLYCRLVQHDQHPLPPSTNQINRSCSTAMPFSSRRGAGGWAQSILPTTKPAAKQPRKPRRRTTAAFRDFIISNFFRIGLCFTFIFFIIILFRFTAVPKPLQFRSSTSRARSARPRKPVVHKSPNQTILAATVDITTKELYDKIQFLDEDGGPWKQGWRVNYKGNEWDEEKLKVFVVPHSHNDPGWRLTVDEYYDRQSRHILDTIVETLSKVTILPGFKL